jgi:RNA polymerase sigma-70 factor (ECF subfamily)
LPTDYELAQRALDGDLDAFVALHGRLRRFTYHAARLIAGNHEDAEDIAQVTWLWLAERKWRLDPNQTRADGALHGFISRLVSYAAWRRLHPIPTDERDDFDGIAQLHSQIPDPETRLLSAELRERILDAIHSLPPQLRRVAILRYRDELPGPAIAALIGVTAAAVPAYFAEIRRRLRPQLQDLVDVPAPNVGRARGGHVRYDGDRYARRVSAHA